MIIDTHHHIWDLGANYYPWLSDRVTPKMYGDYSDIRRNYLVEDFLLDAASAGVSGSVHIQAGFDSTRPVDETRWIESVADSRANSRALNALIGQIPFDELALHRLDQHMLSARFRGIRQILSDFTITDAELEDYLSTPQATGLLDEMQRRNLILEFQARPDQHRPIVNLMERYPELRIGICHAAMPIDQSAPGLALWREAITAFAANPQAFIKLSGFGMFDAAWTTLSVQGLVAASIEAFGASRVVFGSNYPVERLSKSYADYWRIVRETVSDYTLAEQVAMLRDNAIRVYTLNLPEEQTGD